MGSVMNLQKAKVKIFMLVISKTKDQSESDFDVGDVRFEPRRLVVVVLHPLAHADEAGLLIRRLPRSARFHFHDQSSRMYVHLNKAGVELRTLLLENWC